MLGNTGSRIKKISQAINLLGILLSLGFGVALIIIGADAVGGETLIITGIAIGVVGSILSWISSLVLFAYGDMAENVHAMASIMVKNEMKKMKTNKPQIRRKQAQQKAPEM